MNEPLYVPPRRERCAWGHRYTPANLRWYKHTNGRYYALCRRCRSVYRRAREGHAPRPARTHALSPADTEVLNLLLATGGLTGVQIQRATRRDKGSAWWTMQRLQRAKLVVADHPHGGRALLYRLNGIQACRA